MADLSSRFSRRASAAAVAIAAAFSLGVHAAPVQAATVAPGAPMRMQPVGVEGLPNAISNISCSQGFAGTVTPADGTPKDVMVTAGHCVTDIETGVALLPEVYFPRTTGNERIGVVDVYGFNPQFSGGSSLSSNFAELWTHADWTTVNVDDPASMTGRVSTIDAYGNRTGEEVLLTGIRDYRNVPVGTISVDNFGQPICKDGMNAGRACGFQLARTQHSVFNFGLNYANGDSGGINWDPFTGEVIGVTSQGIGPFGRAQAADAALQDAYGIPDGQVNDHFKIAPDNGGLDEDVRSFNDDAVAADQWMEDQGLYVVTPADVRDIVINEAKVRAEELGTQAVEQAREADVAGLKETADAAAHDAVMYGETIATMTILDALEN